MVDHSFQQGWTMRCAGTIVIMKKYDPEKTLQLIEQHKCTSTFMAPTLLKVMKVLGNFLLK